jgi:hypothetical protein
MSPVKIPFNLLYIEVDKLYRKEFNPNDIKGINAQCEFIGEFIRAAGYTEDEFIRLMCFGSNNKLN